ncbi:MAG: GAF domain-containing protein [Ktedonobacteraceae bacterium]|nr:GAF domain-containing protein [Ktedonobacteraceae bacterium]
MEERLHASIFEESAVVERVARIVSSVRGARPDYTRLAAELEQAISFDVFGIVLLRHDRQAVRVVICRREEGSWQTSQHQLPRGESMLEQVLQDPVLRANEYPDGLDGPPSASGDALSGFHQLRSTLIAPLKVEDSVLGTLELGSTIEHIYADATFQRLIDAVAQVIASAIESAQLGGSADIQNRQRQVLKDVSSALTSKMDLSTILNQIVNGIAESLKVSSLIIMQERRDGHLRVEAQAGLDQKLVESAFQHFVPVNDQCIIGHMLQHRQPFFSQDIAIDERFPISNALFSQFGVRSVFCYPLVTGTTVYGALLLCSPEPGGFTPLKIDILSLFASQATVAIHNGILLESAHQRSRFQEAIERLERAHYTSVSGSRHLSAAMQEDDEYKLFVRMREETQRTFGISFASLMHFIGDYLLTRSERDLQAILSAEQDEPYLTVPENIFKDTEPNASFSEPMFFHSRDALNNEQKEPLADTLSLLTQTAEVALARTGMLGELSRLLLQVKQSADGVRDAWFVIDLRGNCVYLNPAAEALCDTRLEQITATYGSHLLAQLNEHVAIEDVFAKLFPRMRNVEEVRLYLREFMHGNIYQQELRCVLASEPLAAHTPSQRALNSRRSLSEHVSSDYHYQFARHSLYNQQGQVSANALQVRDVTEQVRDEKNRSALLSAVSHDLRTPLTTIKAAVTGLLQEGVEWEEQDRRAMLEDIDTETDHLTVLVNALVELSRIEMGALVLEKEWCDVTEVVYGALVKVERVLAGRPVCTHFQSPLPLIYVDHVQLERVFYNLLENVARSSSQPTEIGVHVDVIGESQKLLRVRVLDYGYEVPIQERERIFQTFYSPGSDSNGLGLAICKGIIEAHQGRISVEALPGGGSCFIFTVPLHPQAVTEVLSMTSGRVGQPLASRSVKQASQSREIRGEDER